VLVSEARGGSSIFRVKIFSHSRTRYLRSRDCAGQVLGEAFDAGASSEQGRDSHGNPDAASRRRWSSFTTRTRNRGWAHWSCCTIWNPPKPSSSELELSRRMAAIGRLTSGVGHEVKNPINAIVVHLELLKTKLGDASGPAVRHLEVIDSEIHRLDRVVQMLVDFSRPVELDLREQDLRKVVGDVLSLATAELSTRNVTLVSNMPPNPLVANIDADLLKQAVLNVILNGAQSMPNAANSKCFWRKTGEPRFSASPMRAPAFPTKFGRRSSTCTSPPRATAAASGWP